uniref:Uncharacterized protein n=1 Tax=Eptatretus burgeri TaxID=7764 RepID=A0A8C4WXF7_EPTBU
MASSSYINDRRYELTCAVCLQLFEEPITLPCGHSFCLNCLENYWDREEPTVCFCPNCREVFPQKPKLKKSVTLASLVEQMNVSGQVEANDEAAMRCITCDMLCCGGHGKTNKHKGHKLVELEIIMEDLRCTEQANSIDFYCKDDETLVCLMCKGEHQDHEVVPVEVALAEFKVLESQPLSTAEPRYVIPSELFTLCRYFCRPRSITLSEWSALRRPARQLTMATLSGTRQLSHEHPDRFDVYPQVLSSESFSSGRHYWEVDVSLSRTWVIGICLNSMGRKGRASGLGMNPKSWCLRKRDNKYTTWHNKQGTLLSVLGNPERIGFLLDCEEGELTCFGDSRVLHVFRGNFMDSVKPIQMFTLKIHPFVLSPPRGGGGGGGGGG